MVSINFSEIEKLKEKKSMISKKVVKYLWRDDNNFFILDNYLLFENQTCMRASGNPILIASRSLAKTLIVNVTRRSRRRKLTSSLRLLKILRKSYSG